MVETRRYVFAPLEQRGVVAGLRAGQVGLLGAGLVVDVGLLRAMPDIAGVAAAGVVMLAATAAAFVAIAGRPVEQWAPTVTRRACRVLTGAHRTTPRGRRSPTPGSMMPIPSAFAGLKFDEVPRVGASPMGVVRDGTTGTLTAVLAVRGRSFTLLDAVDKERRLASWSAVLAGLSREGGPVRSLQWVERTVPGDSDALVRHFDEAAVVRADTPAGRSYMELIAEAGPLGQEHECFVALTIRGPRRHNPQAVDAMLLREVRLLEGQLRSAEVDVDHALSRRELGGVLRTAFDPRARTAIGRRRALHADLDGPLPDGAWPASTEESWSWWRTDETWHATFWVAEWPRSEVSADFLTPLLLHAAGQRTISVVMRPLPPSAGVREAEAARTAQVADDDLRQRAGFLATARRRREGEGIARREAELSDGHAAYRFSGYVTVTAADRQQLEVACGEVIQAAHQCRLELRLLHGAQDLAFAWTLPFGRGLAGR